MFTEWFWQHPESDRGRELELKFKKEHRFKLKKKKTTEDEQSFYNLLLWGSNLSHI